MLLLPTCFFVKRYRLSKAYAAFLTGNDVRGRKFVILSHLVRKPTFCICETKDADQLRGVTAKLISAFVFATWIVQFLIFLNPKCPTSSPLQCLYSPVCVEPVRKPHYSFSHEAALIFPGWCLLLHSVSMQPAKWKR